MMTCDPLDGGVRQLNPSTLFDTRGSSSFQILWEDCERVFYRGVSRANAVFKPGLYDVNGSLVDFLTSCKAAMGLGGTAPISSFIA